jgi:cyclohexadieny/prephenate dehydrogenase
MPERAGSDAEPEAPPEEAGATHSTEPALEPHFERLALIGLGLIGSSIARAARELGLARAIVAIDRDPAVLARAAELGLADETVADAATGVEEADHVILCVPVGAYGAVAGAIRGALQPGAIVSDVGSVKSAVLAAMTPHLPPGVHLVPAHPVAGTEHSGPDAGFSALFRDRWCILTPPDGTDRAAVERVRAFWTAMGSNVEIMTAAHHDLVLAITSHVPHLIAYNIVGTAADLETVTQSEVIKFSAGGFRDFTRIAASDPTMWRDVFLNNKEAVLEMLGRFNEDIAALARAIRWGDGDALFDLFTRTREIRRGIISVGQETPEPDFGRRR